MPKIVKPLIIDSLRCPPRHWVFAEKNQPPMLAQGRHSAGTLERRRATGLPVLLGTSLAAVAAFYRVFSLLLDIGG